MTAVGLVLLLSFKTPDLPPATGGGGRLGAVVQPTASSKGGPIAGRTGGAATPPPPTNGRGHPAATPTAAPGTRAPAATPAQANGDVTGPAIDTPYGPVQVEAKTSGGRIVDVVAVELPNDRRRSQQISQYVEPILHDEALQAQAAQIDSVSGATYTSEAYMRSLQAALDQLHG